jgi:hypothetical protein
MVASNTMAALPQKLPFAICYGRRSCSLSATRRKAFSLWLSCSNSAKTTTESTIRLTDRKWSRTTRSASRANPLRAITAPSAIISSRSREGRSPVPSGPSFQHVSRSQRTSAAAPMPMNNRPDQKSFDVRTAQGVASLSILAGNVPAACAVACGFPAGFSHDQRILELDVTAGRMRQRRLDGDHHSWL